MKFAKELEREAVPDPQSPKSGDQVDPPASSRWHGATDQDSVKIAKQAEDEALTSHGNGLQYGSFVPTPAAHSRPLTQDGHQSDEHDDHNTVVNGDSHEDDDDFELPAPAIHTTSSSPGTRQSFSPVKKSARFNFHRSNSSGPLGSGTLPPLASPSAHDEPLRRIFSGVKDSGRIAGLARQSLDLVREREQQFYEFMDSELEKVETFYKKNEDRAGHRLLMLREQLHEMRNRRIQEIANEETSRSLSRLSNHEGNPDKSNGWVHPLKSKIFPPGPNSKSFQSMPQTPHLAAGERSHGRMDYVRRPENQEVAYRTAKRKLKLAMQEFYRSLELLKSYAMLNRTAFRKLNKKFDKAVNARPPMRYMNEKVNKAWFVNSDVLEGHIKAVEDLYARYFERGNQKLAVGKLRKLHRKPKDESGSSFLNGFFIGTGAVFTIQGLVYGSQLLYDNNPTIRIQTSYLLQIYGGFFLMLMLFSLFCINCSIWMRNKVNYQFIFEFDQRSMLDWRQLAEFPSFFLLLLGVTMWVNFSRYGDDSMYLYYPVVLIGLSVLIILLPFPVLSYKSRIWDLFMDFSLLQPQSRHTALRDILALKHHWVYYVIMAVDPILRFAWIFYAIFTHDLQHSTIVSFLVSFAEVFRRGIWSLLRVENEHCANVAQYKASRDVPLPYQIEPLMERASTESSPMIQPQGLPPPPQPQPAEHPSFYDSASSTAVAGPPSGSLLRRRTDFPSPGITRSFSKVIAEAHKQDFEKKRKPINEVSDVTAVGGQSDDFDDDDDDDDDDDAATLPELQHRDGGDAA
ncbi:protein SYG1 homolog [Trichoderma asperellum]|uniref:Protein SYG1 homolog n=1 Tax=Trichoderma asperellum TaxID=101201 RepID=A0A6V8QST4_TRIAP|nr:protein SYG1 homolog [Trichoderma asperellum]